MSATTEYRISTVDADAERTADAVIVNREGAWLAEQTADNRAQYLTDEDGDYIPAPRDWRTLVHDGE